MDFSVFGDKSSAFQEEQKCFPRKPFPAKTFLYPPLNVFTVTVSFNFCCSGNFPHPLPPYSCMWTFTVNQGSDREWDALRTLLMLDVVQYLAVYSHIFFTG